MALDPIMIVRTLIGDVPTSPFYQLFDDETIQQFLDMSGQDVYAAAKLAAISASFQLAGWSTREKTGDIEVWNTLSTQYLKALENLIKNPSMIIPQGLFPWSANQCSNNKLMNIDVCDTEGFGSVTEDNNTCGC